MRRWIYSAVISDACDAAGLRAQAPDLQVRQLSTDTPVIVGWARPALAVPVEEVPEKPYDAEIDFLDSLILDDVPVITSAGTTPALWGELFSAAAMARGAAGALIVGSVRDQRRIRDVGFPVFASSAHSTDCLGRTVLEPRAVLEIADVAVHNGDLVVVDEDGVVIVPGLKAAEILAAAEKKAAVERSALQMLSEGRLLRDAWNTHGVL